MGKETTFSFQISQVTYIISIQYAHNLLHEFNPFSTPLYPLKASENLGFFMFSGGIEVEHWLKMS